MAPGSQGVKCVRAECLCGIADERSVGGGGGGGGGGWEVGQLHVLSADKNGYNVIQLPSVCLSTCLSVGSKSTNEDVPAGETSIPSHLDHMLHLLCRGGFRGRWWHGTYVRTYVHAYARVHVTMLGERW